MAATFPCLPRNVKCHVYFSASVVMIFNNPFFSGKEFSVVSWCGRRVGLVWPSKRGVGLVWFDGLLWGGCVGLVGCLPDSAVSSAVDSSVEALQIFCTKLVQSLKMTALGAAGAGSWSFRCPRSFRCCRCCCRPCKHCAVVGVPSKSPIFSCDFAVGRLSLFWRWGACCWFLLVYRAQDTNYALVSYLKSSTSNVTVWACPAINCWWVGTSVLLMLL